MNALPRHHQSAAVTEPQGSYCVQEYIGKGLVTMGQFYPTSADARYAFSDIAWVPLDPAKGKWRSADGRMLVCTHAAFWKKPFNGNAMRRHGNEEATDG